MDKLSQAALGRGVCEQDDWRNGKGRYCEASLRKALPRLAKDLKLELPSARPGPVEIDSQGAEGPGQAHGRDGGPNRAGGVAAAPLAVWLVRVLEPEPPLGQEPGVRRDHGLPAAADDGALSPGAAARAAVGRHG